TVIVRIKRERDCLPGRTLCARKIPFDPKSPVFHETGVRHMSSSWNTRAMARRPLGVAPAMLRACAAEKREVACSPA
ncbi:hypothetical protein WAI94_19690, partial [Acinetobacter baumannii]